jgi:hypothetical protein
MDLQQSVALIHGNMINSMKMLIDHSDNLSRRRSGLRTSTKRSSATSKDFMRRLPYDARVDVEVAHHLHVLWRDPGIRRTFELRAMFHIPDEVDYFFDRLDAISQPNYDPKIEDIMRIYVRTTGIVDEEIKTSSGVRVHIIDIGGQRNERLKWQRVLRASRCVVFVVAASEYDQNLYEDGETNRIDESLKLFQSIATAEHLLHMNIALVFTKTDQFATKIASGKANLKEFFPAYDGAADDKDAALAFLTNMFVSRLSNPSRLSHVSHTNLLDPKQAEETIRALDIDQMISKRRIPRQRNQ